MTYKLLLDEIKRLLREWDPIGVFGDPENPGPDDEYDRYAPMLLAALSRGAAAVEVQAMLGRFQSEQMGLRESPRENLALAHKLLQAWQSRRGDEGTQEGGPRT